MPSWVLLLLVLVLLLAAVMAPEAPEAFDGSGTGAEKVKNVLVYLGVAGTRSPAGTWTQDDQQALQALSALLGTGADATAVYQAQAFLKRTAGYSSKPDGVASAAYTAAAARFVASMDPAALAIARAVVATYNQNPSGLT